VQVTRGVVLFSPVYRSDLEDTFEDTDHDLLVKLRALREICRAAKVVDFEQLCTTFGAGRDNLRRVDLGEPLPGEKFTKRRTQNRLDLEDRSHFLVSQSERTVIKHAGKRE